MIVSELMGENIFQFSAAFCGTAAFAVLVQVRGWLVAPAALGGAIAWLVYYYWFAATGSYVSAAFLGAIAAAVYSEIMARLLRRAVILFIACAIIPLVPGAMLYQTMFYAVSEKSVEAVQKGVATLIVAGALCAGIAAVASVMLVYKQAIGKVSFHPRFVRRLHGRMR